MSRGFKLKTTIPFHKNIVTHTAFKSGKVHTKFIESMTELVSYREIIPEHLRLAGLMAEITAMGHNPYLGLGAYRKAKGSRVGPMPGAQVSSSDKSKANDYRPPFNLMTIEIRS